MLSYGVFILFSPGKESSSQVHRVPVLSTADYSADISRIQFIGERDVTHDRRRCGEESWTNL